MDENENISTDVDIAVEKTEGEHTEQQTEAAAPSRYELEARSQGWVPKEEWNGDPEAWTDAKEFCRRGELMHKISSQSSEIKDLRKAISGLMEHHNKVKETEYKRAVEYLKQEKKKAFEEGDADKVLAVEDAMETLKSEQVQKQEVQQQQTAKGPTPVFIGWVKQNPWYAQDQELREFADTVGVGYFNRNPGVAEEELYNLVKQRVIKAYPEKFKGRGSSVPAVEGGSTGSPVKKDGFKLSEDEERVMKTFVRSGVMTKEQYIAELRKVKGVS